MKIKITKADRALIARLFGDIFSEIAEMRLAILHGDRLEANRELSQTSRHALTIARKTKGLTLNL